MDESIVQKLEEQGRKIESIAVSVEKTRKYFLWTLIVSVIFFLLPLIGLLFVLPFFLGTLGAYAL